MPKFVIGWHDPNFGVRSTNIYQTIEAAADSTSLRFVAENSLSLLSESESGGWPRPALSACCRASKSWYCLGFKSKTGAKEGMAKVKQVADHVNMLLEHVPYVQTNFVLGLDEDKGSEPFELTKCFVDKVPGAFPAYSQRSAFGEATPENLDLQRAGRVLGFPFHFLDNNQVMNVVPKNYEWDEFYANLTDLTEYTFSARALLRRWRSNSAFTARLLNLIRGASSEGKGRIRHYRRVRRALAADPAMRRYFEQESSELPRFYLDKMRKDLGPMWDLLPKAAIRHDPHAFMKKSDRAAAGKSAEHRFDAGERGRILEVDRI